MLLYAMLALSALGIALLVYRYDLYEREPWPMLLLAVLLGAVLMWVAGRVQIFAITRLGARAASDFNFSISAAAAVTEELAKLAVVVVIALGWRRQFNDPIDGLMYGSFAGLGCAIEEAVFLHGVPPLAAVMPLQEPIRLLGHLVMGGIAGFGVGLWRVRFAAWPVAIAACWAAAAGLHFTWDRIAFSAADHGRMLPYHTIGAIATMFTGLFLYGSLVAVASGMSRRLFAPDSPTKLLGWPFVRQPARRQPGGRPDATRMSERSD
jgi:RsiW-degrading membrane proteinase PrsW (M82 family)